MFVSLSRKIQLYGTRRGFISAKKALFACRSNSTGARSTSIDMEYEGKRLNLGAVNPLAYHDTVRLAWNEFKYTKKAQPSGKPIVLVHGLFGCLANFRSVGRKLNHLTQRPVYGVDLRNHGRSPHSFPFTYETLSNDVISLMRQENWANATVVGHSMGAKVAMLVALRAPELVSNLVVVDNSPVSTPLEPQFIKDLLGLAHVEQLTFELKLTMQQRLFEARNILKPYESDHLVQTFLLSNMTNGMEGHNLRIPALQMLKYGITDAAGGWPDINAKYSGPTLVLHAKYSLFVQPLHLTKAFPRYFPDCKLIEYNSGHWIVSEQPEQFVNDVVKFM